MIGSNWLIRREMVGWLTSNNSARTSCVILFFAYINVAFTACPNDSAGGLPPPLDHSPNRSSTSRHNRAKRSTDNPCSTLCAQRFPEWSVVLW